MTCGCGADLPSMRSFSAGLFDLHGADAAVGNFVDEFENLFEVQIQLPQTSSSRSAYFALESSCRARP